VKKILLVVSRYDAEADIDEITDMEVDDNNHNNNFGILNNSIRWIAIQPAPRRTNGVGVLGSESGSRSGAEKSPSCSQLLREGKSITITITIVSGGRGFGIRLLS